MLSLIAFIILFNSICVYSSVTVGNDMHGDVIWSILERFPTLAILQYFML